MHALAVNIIAPTYYTVTLYIDLCTCIAVLVHANYGKIRIKYF